MNKKLNVSLIALLVIISMAAFTACGDVSDDGGEKAVADVGTTTDAGPDLGGKADSVVPDDDVDADDPDTGVCKSVLCENDVPECDCENDEVCMDDFSCKTEMDAFCGEAENNLSAGSTYRCGDEGSDLCTLILEPYDEKCLLACEPFFVNFYDTVTVEENGSFSFQNGAASNRTHCDPIN